MMLIGGEEFALTREPARPLGRVLGKVSPRSSKMWPDWHSRSLPISMTHLSVCTGYARVACVQAQFNDHCAANDKVFAATAVAISGDIPPPAYERGDAVECG